MPEIQITNQLSEKLLAGINLYGEITSTDRQKLETHIQREIISITKQYQEKMPPGYEFSRKLYREFHIDPTKNRPSSEALWRRLKNKGDFPRVNPYVDLTNLLSLSFQVCFGLYDLEKIEGDVRLCLGTDSDQFQGIGKDILHMKGKITLKDSLGAFGNPSSDSLRTSVDPSATRIMQILFFHKQDPAAETLTRKAAQTFSDFFQIRAVQSSLI
jgi:DNA/RNA-binding domain of Phe-tRNA-synthetase-like protein